MKLKDVPQDPGMIDGDRREVCYAVDQDGRYVLAQSTGWKPKNVANDQAWDLVREKLNATAARIRAGKQSPLAYHMVRNQMSIGLLARYVRYSRVRVWWHLRPKVFDRSAPEVLKPYADLFDLTLAELKKVPDGMDAQKNASRPLGSK